MTMPEGFKNAAIPTVHLDLCLTKARLRKSLIAPFSNCIPSTRKQKAGVFKFLRFEERFRKAPFSWRGGLTIEIFQISPALCGRCLIAEILKLLRDLEACVRGSSWRLEPRRSISALAPVTELKACSNALYTHYTTLDFV